MGRDCKIFRFGVAFLDLKGKNTPLLIGGKYSEDNTDVSSDIVETLEDLKDVAHDAKSMLTTGLSTDYIKKSIAYDWSLNDLKNIKLKDKKNYMLVIKEKAVEILQGKKVVYTC